MLTIKKIAILAGIILSATETSLMAQDARLHESNSMESAKTKSFFEANVLLPFVGISDLKVLLPARNQKSGKMFENAWVLGIYADYGWGNLTRAADKYGKVRFIGIKVGWRQFLWKGLHVDATVNMGKRHEENNIYDGTTLNSFTSRGWVFSGWQGNINPRMYYNVRAGLGINIIRTGDRYASTEREFAPALDINLGFRL